MNQTFTFGGLTLHQLLGIVLACVAVAYADCLLSDVGTASKGDFGAALTNIKMYEIVALYLIQILIFTYVFVKNGTLMMVGMTQTVMYALVVMFYGAMFRNESIPLTKALGAGVAVLGILIMTASGG